MHIGFAPVRGLRSSGETGGVTAANCREPSPRRQDRGAFWSDLAVLAIALVWGASYPVAKAALCDAPVLVLIFYRFFITAVVMSAIAWQELVTTSGGERMRGLLLGAILFAIFLAETHGVALTTATNTALLISLCTVFTPLLDYGLSRRLPPAGVLSGAVVACIGVCILTGGVSALSSGDWLVLGAAVLRAVMVVTTKRVTADRSMSSAALTALQAVTVAGLTLVLLVSQRGVIGLVVQGRAHFWGAVAFLSLFCTIAAFHVQNAAIRRTSPTRVSLLMGT